MTKQFYNAPNKNLAKSVYKLCRMELSRFVRIITGHNGLFYFKSKIDKEISPACRFCLEKEETFHHLVDNCPIFNQNRVDIFRDTCPDSSMQWKVKDLLSFSNIPVINVAIEGDTAFGQDSNDSSNSSYAIEPD